jgi:hypothetical protein
MSFDGLDPPGIAGELEQHHWMLQHCWRSSISAFCNSSSVVKTVFERCLRICRKTCSAGFYSGL